MGKKDNKDKTEKAVAILGLGKYGKSLAKNLYEMGIDVLVADSDEDVVSEFTAYSTAAVCANLNNEEEVLQLGLENMDVVITAMGSNLAASIICVSVAKEMGVPYVGAKTTSDRMTTILKKVGADGIYDPEEEGGARTASLIASKYLQDSIQIDENFTLLSMLPKEEWVGKTLQQLDLRRTLNINVIASRESEGLWHFVDPDKVIEKETMLIIGAEKSSKLEV